MDQGFYIVFVILSTERWKYIYIYLSAQFHPLVRVRANLRPSFRVQSSFLPCAISVHAQNMGQALAQAGEASNSVSSRNPSSTVGFLVMAQLQFLATMSLVDPEVTEGVSEFSVGLRLVNPDLQLHFTTTQRHVHRVLVLVSSDEQTNVPPFSKKRDSRHETTPVPLYAKPRRAARCISSPLFR